MTSLCLGVFFSACVVFCQAVLLGCLVTDWRAGASPIESCVPPLMHVLAWSAKCGIAALPIAALTRLVMPSAGMAFLGAALNGRLVSERTYMSSLSRRALT